MDFFTNKEIEIFHTSTILYMRRTGAYGKENYVLMEKFKEKSNIIGISQSCSGGSIRLNSTEKISAEAGERIQNLAEF